MKQDFTVRQGALDGVEAFLSVAQHRSFRRAAAEAGRFQSQTPNWELRDDGQRIERTFRFRNFQEALGFVRDLGDLAETEGHHPDISFGWGYATVSLRTKKIKGLHGNDFIMASKIDRMFDLSDGPPDRQ
jgi:4a-hydroxytetrahydrobiopterin dehydratase